MGVIRRRKVESYSPHAPTQEELFAALRNPRLSLNYWRSLFSHSVPDLPTSEFDERLKTALLEGGFKRVHPDALTRDIERVPGFNLSPLSSVPCATVPFRYYEPIYGVHRTPTFVEPGFLRVIDGTRYFFQELGQVRFTTLRDPHWSWPECDRESPHRPPVRASIFWRT